MRKKEREDIKMASLFIRHFHRGDARRYLVHLHVVLVPYL